MTKNQKDQYSKQSGSKTNEPSAGEKKENPQIFPDQPLPNRPTVPAKPNENPDPTRSEPGIYEPDKNDPTRVDEPPQIFNTN